MYIFTRSMMIYSGMDSKNIMIISQKIMPGKGVENNHER
jgi:hypothetical protein